MKIAVPLGNVERLTFLLLLKYIMAQLLQIKVSKGSWTTLGWASCELL
jgi:hypothetical protein